MLVRCRKPGWRGREGHESGTVQAHCNATSPCGLPVGVGPENNAVRTAMRMPTLVGGTAEDESLEHLLERAAARTMYDPATVVNAPKIPSPLGESTPLWERRLWEGA